MLHCINPTITLILSNPFLTTLPCPIPIILHYRACPILFLLNNVGISFHVLFLPFLYKKKNLHVFLGIGEKVNHVVFEIGFVGIGMLVKCYVCA
jgi:hypothetical protein